MPQSVVRDDDARLLVVSSEEAALADAAAHDREYHVYKAQYQAALETLGLPPAGKAKAGVKALPEVDCSPI